MFDPVDVQQIFEGGEIIENTYPTEIHTERGLITQDQTNETSHNSGLDKLKEEAKLRVKLEDLVKIKKSYKTLYEGLKLNTPHNSAITHPLLFLLQRVIYAVVIVCMARLPTEFACIILMVMSLIILSFTITERPWKDSRHTKLAIFNELCFYLLLVISLALTCLISTDRRENEIFGWIIIGLVTLATHVNLVFILAEAWNHSKLLYIRFTKL